MMNVVICVKHSTKAKDMESVDNGESEVLYGRGSKFRVTDVVEHNGKLYVQEEETP